MGKNEKMQIAIYIAVIVMVIMLNLVYFKMAKSVIDEHYAKTIKNYPNNRNVNKNVNLPKTTNTNVNINRAGIAATKLQEGLIDNAFDLIKKSTSDIIESGKESVDIIKGGAEITNQNNSENTDNVSEVNVSQAKDSSTNNEQVLPPPTANNTTATIDNQNSENADSASQSQTNANESSTETSIASESSVTNNSETTEQANENNANATPAASNEENGIPAKPSSAATNSTNTTMSKGDKIKEFYKNKYKNYWNKVNNSIHNNLGNLNKTLGGKLPPIDFKQVLTTYFYF